MANRSLFTLATDSFFDCSDKYIVMSRLIFAFEMRSCCATHMGLKFQDSSVFNFLSLLSMQAYSHMSPQLVQM